MKGHIPLAVRDDWARKALEMYESGQRMIDIEAYFDVSNPTARNLVSRGSYLRAQSMLDIGLDSSFDDEGAPF